MDPNEITDTEIEKYVREIAAQEAAKASADQNPISQEPQQFKMNIAGQEMTFSNPEEASNAVNAALYQATQNQKETPGRRVNSDEETPGHRTWGKDDQTKYVDLLTTNPVAASEYVDEFRFGVKNPTELIKRNMQATQQMATQLTIDQFVSANKDYQPTQDNAVAMQRVLQELGGGVTPTSLEAAYAIADRRGMIHRDQPNKKNREENPYLRTPPPAGRNASSESVSSDFESQVENMSKEQIETFFSRYSR